MNNVSASIFAIGMPSGMEWIWILLIILLLFGGAKLPSLAKGLGQSIKEFKKASSSDDEQTKSTAAPATTEPAKKAETTKTHGSN
jgi:sec-independent protein translocase protein TatA